jgi:methylated-DNA-[protein]-cysteine S-methyltransferase
MRRVLAGQATAKEILAACDFSNSTDFERKVLAALAKVRRGGVISYGELATAAGSPRAARAVGSALGKNRIPILLPCHRVVASNGIGGFGGSAGSGWRPAGQDPIRFKRALLANEGVLVR